MSNDKIRLFIVDDDQTLSFLMKEYFEDEEFQVSCFDDGRDALDSIIREQPDLVVLDLDMPNMDGIEICRKARKHFSNPIVMLTGNDSEFVEIASLNTGVDKFLLKPVKLQVLLAHLNAMLRWHSTQARGANSVSSQIDRNPYQSIVVHQGSMTAMVDGQSVALTDCELTALTLLVDNAGQCVSRDELYQRIRGFDYDGFDRNIDLKISALRKKLNDTEPPFQRIKTVRGKGYLLCDSSVSG